MRSSAIAAALAAWLLPAIAQAQNAQAQYATPTLNEIDLGAGWQSGTSYQYGRYNGMPNAGWFAAESVHLHGGDAWDSGGTGYYDIQANLMGWYDRSLHMKFGQQGTWDASFSYDYIPYFRANDFHTVFGPNGSLVPGVAPGSINNVTTQLTGRLPVMNIGTERDIYAGNLKFTLGDWQIEGGATHEHKQGYQENSLAWLGMPAPVLNNGNLSTTALSYFAQPVSYDTDRYDISATFNGERLQAVLGYDYSQFTDNTAAATLANPFAFTAAAAGGSLAKIEAIYALPPSNSAHQVRAQFGYDLTPTTRVNATLQYGIMQQNQPFTAPTGNGNATTVIAPPGTGFDGLIETIFGYIAIAATPLPLLDLTAHYTLDDRNNLSPRNGFSFYVNDGPTPNPNECNAPAAGGLCSNLPVSYLHQQAGAEASYRILPGTRLTLGASYGATHRTFSNANDTTEASVDAKVRSHLADGVDASVGYTHADRWAQAYNGGNQVFSLLNAAAQSDVFGFYDYYLASRLRDKVKAMLDLTPLPGLAVTLIAEGDFDHYPQSTAGLGLKSNSNVSIGPDLAYQVNAGFSVHAYYTYQRIFFDQSSLVPNGGCNGAGSTLTPGPGCLGNGAYTGKTGDATNTLGIGADWRPLGDDTVKLSLDYTFDAGNISYTLADGGVFAFPSGGATGTAALLIQPLPPVTSTLNSIVLKADYLILPNVSLHCVYAFQRFNYKDYATGVGATQLSNAVLPGEGSPNYTIHTIIAQLRVRW